MPNIAATSILSLIVVSTWGSIYFFGNYKKPSSFIQNISYEVVDENIFYPMDDPGTVSTDESAKTVNIPDKSPLTEPNILTATSPIIEEVKTETNYEYQILIATTTEMNQKIDHLAWMHSEDLTAEDKRNHVKKMMKHAWDNYVKYAWGWNELKPISKAPHHRSIFGSAPTGVTIIDSLDTLHVMGLLDEFRKGRDWVVNEFNVTALESEFSVFEVNIRLVGGLLSCYALTGNSIFKEKAQEIADKLLPAFDTRTGIPLSLVNFDSGFSRNYGWASGGSSILSELGTLHLEFAYLSDITGEPIYRNKTEHTRKLLKDLEKPSGLYPNYINPYTGQWSDHHSSIGSLGDSFYEYLLKAWLQTNKEDEEPRQMYDDAMKAILQEMLQVSPGGLTYFAEKKYSRLEHRMEHLGCFIGGLLALGSKTLQNDMSDKYLEVAKNITHTCHETYDRSYTKLGPEAFRFNKDVEAKAFTSSEDHYILRPEVVESYFYLYRLTKEEKYRKWGWEAVEALERHCRVDGGYTGITTVYSDNPEMDDVQQSFFMSETLKYLYLLFSDDTVYSLDEWVFNTEAHPLPIKDVNPFYRAV